MQLMDSIIPARRTMGKLSTSALNFNEYRMCSFIVHCESLHEHVLFIINTVLFPTFSAIRDRISLTIFASRTN